MATLYEQRYTPEEYRDKPRDYNPEVAEHIITRLENGEMLPTICQDRDMPLPATFLKWVELDPELEKQFVRARRFGAEINMDLMVCVSQGKDTRRSEIFSKALTIWTEKTDPNRYGPRANIRVKEGDEDGGIDYREEVQRRVASIAKKLAPPEDSGDEAEKQG